MKAGVFFAPLPKAYLHQMAKYINPYTDFGFKKLFGEEGNKDLLIDFLNQLLPAHHQIEDLAFKHVEHLPDLPTERKAIFDIHCRAVSGEHFVVEMQKAKINFFKDRALFYLTFPIRDQGKRGEHELETHFDKWIYFLKKLETFDDIPAILREPIFEKAFKTAEVANMTPEQRDEYEQSRLSYLEVKEAVNTAEMDGRKKEKMDIAKEMKEAGEPIEKIKRYTGLTDGEIDKL